MHSFSRVTTTMETQHKDAITELTTKHASEMEALVQKTNATYNTMLHERMNVEDELKGMDGKKVTEVNKEWEIKLQRLKVCCDELRHVMSCHVMSCDMILSYVMYHVVSCCLMLSYVKIYYVLLHDLMRCNVMSCYVVM